MPEFKLDPSDFRAISVLAADISTLLVRGDGILRNLDGTNSAVICTAQGEEDVVAILADTTTAKNHKLVLGPGDESFIINQRKLFIQANGGNVLVQWIPLTVI